MLDNPCNDSATSLANLVIKLTGADVSVVQKIKRSRNQSASTVCLNTFQKI